MKHKKESHLDRLYHYSIRKTNLGVGSVVVGLFLAGSVLNAQAVAAETGGQPDLVPQPETSHVLTEVTAVSTQPELTEAVETTETTTSTETSLETPILASSETTVTSSTTIEAAPADALAVADARDKWDFENATAGATAVNSQTTAATAANLQGQNAQIVDSGDDIFGKTLKLGAGTGNALKISDYVNTGSTDKQTSFALWYKYDNSHQEAVPSASAVILQQDGDGRSLLTRKVDGTYNSYINATNVDSQARSEVNKWEHVAVVFDQSSRKGKFYINGVLDREVDLGASSVDARTSLLIGSHKVATNDNPHPLRGQVDEIYSFDRALTDAEVTKIYSHKAIPLLKRDSLNPLITEARELLTSKPLSADHQARRSLEENIATAEEVASEQDLDLLKTSIRSLSESLTAYRAVSPAALTINPNQVERTIDSDSVFGINHRYSYNGFGSFDETTGQIKPAFKELYDKVSFGSLRYPGGTISNLFNWKTAIGPVADRKDQIHGFYNNPNQTGIAPNFGLAELATFAKEADSEIVYVYSLARGNAQDVADLMEYFNAEVGTNVNGGVDWAAVRASEGHVDPLNVRFFEIGNEMHLTGPDGTASQQYWTTYVPGKTAEQAYIEGGTAAFTKQYAVKEEDWNKTASVSDGTANQVRFMRYANTNPLTQRDGRLVNDDSFIAIKREGVQVFVGNDQTNEQWTEVTDFAQSSATDKHYKIDYSRGAIIFGDGVHGKIPTQGEQVYVSYQVEKDGFIAISRALKNTMAQIDQAENKTRREANVYSSFETRGFIEKMAEKNEIALYDGLTIHPYSGHVEGGSDANTFYDNAMKKAEVNGIDHVKHLVDLMPAGKVPVISEYGIFRNTESQVRSLTHALYIGKTLMEYIKLGSPYVQKHTLVDWYSSGADSLGPTQQAVIQAVARAGASTVTGQGQFDFFATPSAHVLEMLNAGFGDNIIQHNLASDRRLANGVTPVSLLTSKDNRGNIYIAAVNVDREAGQTLSLAIDGLDLAGKRLEIQELTADSITAENTPENPNAVSIKRSDTVLTATPTFELKPHTFVVLKIEVAEDLPVLAESHVSLSESRVTYTGQAHKPEPVVRVGETTLVKGRDYDLTYLNNIGSASKATTAKVIIEGRGNYAGRVTKTFSIALSDRQADDGTVELADSFVATNPASAEAVTAALNSDAYLRKEYTVFPSPQSVTYDNGLVRLDQTINLVIGDGVDIYTRNRLKQILQDKQISYVTSSQAATDKTNIFLGIHGQNSLASTNQATANISSDLFGKIDAYSLLVKDNAISVVGKDTDAVFYGLTTLKHMLKDSEQPVLRSVKVEDFADIKNRGFIEGYYGNPWSNADRAELMRYGGDLKLTQYFFAPKDDLYHNSKWRDLYPAEKLEEIRELARVGNQNKTRYVWTIHPFMHNAMRFNNDTVYQEDLNVIKAKFTQLMQVGVREFGILADDAPNPVGGFESYNKLMEDLTEWLTQQQANFQGLRKEMVFVPHEYWGDGDEAELRSLNQNLPHTSALTLTGGRIWGEVSTPFLNTLKTKLTANGQPYRPVQLWINWPCTDNSKEHLIMGGGEKFLHPNVDPSLIAGIMLNPMQQSEPSKVALFSAAEYTWKVWKSEAEAKRVNDIAFNFVETGTFKDSPESVAFRELGKHMINQDMDSRVVKLEESVELAPKLTEFLTKLQAGQDVTAERAQLRQEFQTLKDAAELYKASGHEGMKAQVHYWLDNTIDQMNALDKLLTATEKIGGEDSAGLWENYKAGLDLYNQSKTYKFWYVSGYQKAELGVQHIKPFILKTLDVLSKEVEKALDPTKLQTSFISNRQVAQGDLSKISDGDLSTQILITTPTTISTGDYVGLQFNRLVPVTSLGFAMGATSNLRDTFTAARIEYLNADGQWTALTGHNFTGNENLIQLSDLAIEAKGVRLVATADKTNTWLGVREIAVNRPVEKTTTALTSSLTHSQNLVYKYGTNAQKALDNNESTEAMFANSNGQDNAPADSWIQLNLNKETSLSRVVIVQGVNDKISRGVIEYTRDGNTWTKLQDVNGERSFDLPTDIVARAVRIRNTQEVPIWWRIAEFKVESQAGVPDFTDTNVASLAETLTDARLGSYTMSLPAATQLRPGDYIGLKLDRLHELESLALASESNSNLSLLYSANGVEWYPSNNISNQNLVRYVRLVNQTDQDQALTSNQLVVRTVEVQPDSLVSTTMGISQHYGSSDVRRRNNLGDLFDGNLTNLVEWTDVPRANGNIVIKLGTERQVRKLRAYIQDGTHNYLRDAKIQVSQDGQNWTDVITVGDGQENTTHRDDSLTDGWTHDSNKPGNRYIEGQLENPVASKFVRIYFTAGYRHRFVSLTELVINDGEFVQKENNPTVTSSSPQSETNLHKQVVDKKVLSSYKVSNQAGDLTYHLSENTDHNHISLVSNLPAGSQAQLKARVVKGDVTAYADSVPTEWIDLGTVTNSFQTFTLPREVSHLLDVKLVWGDTGLEVYELSTYRDTLPEVPEQPVPPTETPDQPTDPGTEVPPVDENPVVPPTTTEPTVPDTGNPADPGTEVPPVDENPVVPPTTTEPTEPTPGNPTDPGTEVPPVDENPVVPPTTGGPTDPAPGNPTDPGTELPPVDENPVVPPTTGEPTDPAPGNPTDPGTEVPPVDENPVVPPTTGEPTDPAPGNPVDPGTEVPPVDDNPVVPPTTTEPTDPAPGNPTDPGTEVPPVNDNPVVPPTTTEPTVPPTTEQPAQPAKPTAPEAPTTYVAPTLVQDTESGVRVVLGKGESTAAVGLTVTHMETEAAATPAALTETDYDLFDIEVVDMAGNPVDITVPAVVTLPVDPGKEVDRVIYLPDGGTAQSIDFTVSDDKSAVTFEANHFSHYGIIYHQTAKGTGTTVEELPTGDLSAKIVAPVYTPDKPTYSLEELLGAPVQPEPGLKSEKPVSAGTSTPLSTASQKAEEKPASPSYSRSARHLPNTGDQANQASLLGGLSLIAGLGLVGAKRRGKHLR